MKKDEWTSLDIPLTEWTSQGITLGDLFQFKFEGVDQWAQADVFLDNIYFWKENSVGLPIHFDNEEPFKGVGGASFELSTDPDDSSNKTGKVTKKKKKRPPRKPHTAKHLHTNRTTPRTTMHTTRSPHTTTCTK